MSPITAPCSSSVAASYESSAYMGPAHRPPRATKANAKRQLVEASQAINCNLTQAIRGVAETSDTGVSPSRREDLIVVSGPNWAIGHRLECEIAQHLQLFELSQRVVCRLRSSWIM